MAQAIPNGYDDVVSALLRWGRSGLIPNTKVVKSYFPPVQDPVTGIRTLVPATVYVTGDLGDRSKIKHSNIDELPNTPYAGSNIEYAYSPTNPVNVRLGTPTYVGTTKVTKAPDYIAQAAVGKGIMEVNLPVYNKENITDVPDYMNKAATNALAGRRYREAAQKAQTQAEYEENLKALKVETSANRAVRDLDHSIPYITDNLSDAQTLFSTPALSPADNYSQFTNKIDMDLVRTKVPAAIPGVLNTVPFNVSDVPATYPKFNFTPPITRVSDPPKAVKNYLTQYANNETGFIIAGNDYKQEMIQDVAVDAPVYLSESPFGEGNK